MSEPRRTLSVTVVALFLVGSTGTACEESIRYTPAVERRDSVGIELVTSPADTRRLPWTYDERFALGGADAGPESFYRLGSAAVGSDSAGRIHVLNTVEHQVATFGPAGAFLRAVGGEGGGPGELRRPANLSVRQSGEISVFDYGKRVLVRWGPTGELLPEMRFPHAPMMGGRHHALTDDGYLVSTGGRVDGERVNRLIAVAGEDTVTLTMAPQPAQGMVRFERCGGGINFPPLFTPSVVWDHRSGLTAAAPGHDYRIDLWRDGRLVRSVRRPIPGTEATRELAVAEAGEGLTIDFGRGPCNVPPDEYADARGWAATVPAIRRLALGPEGQLWVERWVPGEDVMPIDIFGADGAYRGTLPAGLELPALLFGPNRVGVTRLDELDVARLVVADVVEETGNEGP